MSTSVTGLKRVSSRKYRSTGKFRHINWIRIAGTAVAHRVAPPWAPVGDKKEKLGCTSICFYAKHLTEVTFAAWPCCLRPPTLPPPMNSGRRSLCSREGGREGLGIVGVARRPQPSWAAAPPAGSHLLPAATDVTLDPHAHGRTWEPPTTVNSEQSRLDKWRKD